MPAKVTWDVLLRSQIKLEHGKGWLIGEQSGRVKLTYRDPLDRSRTSVMLDLEWAPSSSSKVLNAITSLRERMESCGLSLRAAHEVSGQAVAQTDGSVDWQKAADRFLASLADRKPRTLADLRSRVQLVLECFQRRPVPKDGGELMATYARLHLGHLRPGSEGRRRHLMDVARFLVFSVEELGAPVRWRPVTGSKRRSLVGAADGREAALTPPIKPEQLESLLDALEAAGRHDLRLAVGLVGLFGLRPAELATLRMDGDRLLVGQVKRNIFDMRKTRTAQARMKERLVLPLDLPGRPGLGAQLAAQWASGLLRFPPQIETAIASGDLKLVGDAFRQYLNRFRPWRDLTEAVPGLTPYSLRHGYAWRAHKCYSRSLSVRDCAALMGHAAEIHMRFYGSWSDEQGLLDAVAALTADQPVQPTVSTGLRSVGEEPSQRPAVGSRNRQKILKSA